ncbi:MULTISPECIES: rhomboid family intramembrane serine protease [Carnobacterium]|uniref:Rhomboid family intramembrane serine protease n=1 Tax=Carnobacterium antarcticum TaxID=2126436 RepID=A0ABW4NPJ3_9LACT|nr:MULTISPECIES: rhomboid family intramembrane serine protease [unclassified Carnobacterium]ALV21305.1 GlpG protein (membrane protein of glp regulon) [Carnobacterium sp. CP1]QQP69327.1 rhomboid family intramembrane serine protease [Carnobacterium sp. CS13]
MDYQTEMKIKRFFKQPLLTYAFLGLQILLFILMTFNGGSTNTHTLIEYGAKFNPFIVLGDWWRLFTPMFLHIGWMHLLLNSIILYYLGIQLESIFGHWRFGLIYLLSGFAGNAASFAFNNAISAGASTAIFGLFGAALMLGKTYPNNPAIQQMSKNFMLLVLINLVFGVFDSSIDLAGHIGGLAGGYLLATAISTIDPLPRWKKRRLQFGGLFLVMVILLLVIGYVRTRFLF